MEDFKATSNTPDFQISSECYEADEAQRDEIEKTIKESGPLISEMLPLSTLYSDFDGHDVYLRKLELLKGLYVGLRRIRRDGNCFYRAFGFAYIEYLLKGNRVEEAKRFIRSCDLCKETLIANGYTQFTVEDFHEQFTGMVEQFVIGKRPLSELEELFNNQSYSDFYVVFLRLLVAAYVQRNADFYAGFIAEGKTVRRFCETEVEPMGLESDNLHVAALALSVGVPICIENCQLSGDLKKIIFPGKQSTTLEEEDESLGVGASTATDSCPVTLLYRPGHYDIIYSTR